MEKIKNSGASTLEIEYARWVLDDWNYMGSAVMSGRLYIDARDRQGYLKKDEYANFYDERGLLTPQGRAERFANSISAAMCSC